MSNYKKYLGVDTELEGLLSEDVRNKLTPFKNLISAIELNFKDRDVETLSQTEKYILDAIPSCNFSLIYLSEQRLIENATKERTRKVLDNAIDFRDYISEDYRDCIANHVHNAQPYKSEFEYVKLSNGEKPLNWKQKLKKLFRWSK